MREEYYKKVVSIAFYVENTTILKKLKLQLVLAMLLELVKKLSTNFNKRQQQYFLIR
jgi:hypothetical protein